ncbi:hypothetical protein Q4E93_13745 [Flavitalea sp. BT771]|uniref:hypothetical protein n=1 Tax=Flavitalea sp. BT771 TaxID=3063329 RepID=UPI0026E48E8C|nr:hypothetical protein [Flavitalea sp. BT771]MDO6431661.1 hypothetical protein [Flavitalea sp. BT771]MDV6220569.1 hypothetical protein [Flavitalea sp. BT771]
MIRNIIRFTFLLILLVSCKFEFGQENHLVTKPEMMAVCNKFMAVFRNKKYTEALQGLKPYSYIEPFKIDTLVATVSQQMSAFTKENGEMLSYEIVSEKDVKDSLIKLTYLAKFKRWYIRFVFILYNNGGGWAITKFDYDQHIDELFQ